MVITIQQRQTADKPARTAYPVVEIFGPTIQGEGPDAGRPAYFIRFGGCDYRCSWCDSMYAVDPAQVRVEARQFTIAELIDALLTLRRGPDAVVLTGGNPAMFELGDLVAELQRQRFHVAVETQGSIWRDWLARADRLVVSPKPPSSGMDTARHRLQFEQFMTHAGSASETAIKIVVFDETDLGWAEKMAGRYANVPFFLSTGTDVGLQAEETLSALLERFRWLCEVVSQSPVFAHAHVMPQLHVLAWGTARGV